MRDGLLIIHFTSLRKKRNLINTLCRYHRTYRCRQIGIWYLHPVWLGSSDYTLDMKILKHYQSIIGVLIWTVSTLVWCGLPYFRTDTIHDKTNRKSCQSGIQSYVRNTYGHTPLQHLLQNNTHTLNYGTGWPIIWKSNRQQSIVLDTTETELDRFVICVR
jgi:hypothetical protein